MSEIPCSGCLQTMPFSSFSSSQMKKQLPRCKVCVEGGVAVSPEATSLLSSSGFRQCSGDKKMLHSSKFSSPLASRCTECEIKRAREEEHTRAEEENHRNRTRAAGACQVKDVFHVYGHLCEIPLEAYREAGVASKWKDWVTKRDVDKASNAWDARSIAHDIDTQWGDMPCGGAYSDSNFYFGPGVYDYY